MKWLAFSCALLLGACANNPGYREGGLASFEPDGADTRVNIPGRQREGDPLWAATGHEQCFAERTRTQNPGTLVPRECVLRNIERTASDPQGAESVQNLRRYAAQMEGFYQLRSGRQQLLTDAGAAVTAFSGIGSAASGGAGGATQGIWLSVAFLPVLVTGINANESTRDLFYAGDIGLRMLNDRYQRLETIGHALATEDSVTRTANAAARSGGDQRLDNLSAMDCSAVQNALGRAAALNSIDDRNLILPEAQRLAAACLAAQSDALYVRRFVRSASALETHRVQDYANDIFLLDRKLVQKDRQLRYSPGETLGLIAAAPFRALDNVLSGQDTNAAIDALRTNVAFEGIDLELAEMRLPAPRAFASAAAPLSDAAKSRRLATRTAAQRQLGIDVSAVLTDLEIESHRIIAEQERLAYQHALISEFHGAASARYMLFDYQASSGLVTVALSATPRPARPTTPTPAPTPTP